MSEPSEMLFLANPLPMWVYDQSTLAFLEVNEAAIRRYGYSREEFLALTIADIRPPVDVPRLLASAAAPRERWMHAGVWRHRTKSGEILFAEIMSHVLTFRDRAAVIVVAHDVTENVRADEALKTSERLLNAAHQQLESSERRYRELVENLSEVVWSIDRSGVLRYVSPAVKEFGYRVEELVGTHFTAVVHPDDRPRLEAQLASAVDGQTARAEFRAIDKHGQVRYVRTSSRPLFDGCVLIGATGLLMDISDQRRIEAELRTAQRLESIGQLAGGVAHDFNNLLVAINGYAELARDRLSPADPVREDLEEIVKAGNRAAALTRQLLAFSRRQVLKAEIVNLNDIVRGMEGMLRRLIREDVRVETSLQPELPSISVDPTQLEQVILNLVVNARDAMPGGGIVRIETRTGSCPRDLSGADHGPGCVVLAVSDNGCGMDAATKARIFEPFFSTKSPGRGTGLGLATVYGIVQQSGGTIDVQSEVGRGATFTIHFPIVIPEERLAAPIPRAAAAGHGGGTILLVEDEPAVRMLAQRVLSGSGYRVLAAADGDEALRIVEHASDDIQLMLTDIVMPGVSGRELAEKVAPLCSRMRVGYMSGYAAGDIPGGQPATIPLRVLQKPFTAAALKEYVRESLSA